MIHSLKKGFTLIELLVVITIIGILATGAVSVYTSQIQKARDTTRIKDLGALQQGVEQSYQDEFVYPTATASWFSDAVKKYVPNLAEDPKNTQQCNSSKCGYVYNVGADSVGITQGAYELSTAFENQGNVDNKAANSNDNGNDEWRMELSNDPTVWINTSWSGSTSPSGINITK